LNTAVDRLIEDVSTRVLKRKLEDNDVVTVNNGVELPCTIFSQLRQGEWFDAWTIRGAMDISDKPLFVQYRYSIPLDEYGRNDRMKSIKRPFAGWARDIAKIRSQAKELSGELVYFCPLNHKNMHFSLLEINEREGVIRHYDSMADQGIINGISTPTRVCRLVQVRPSCKDENGDVSNKIIGGIW
jgi:hypothetical protein